MCGLWAKTSQNREIALNELVHPIRALAHRGPDGYGWFQDNNVALVHTRLSVIDLENGKQPMLSHNGRYIGMVNGELYDYESIRDDLRSQGINFRTDSDSEVLLNLFALKGTTGLSRVSGEFVFVFYDQIEKILYFGRDASGVKPLFMEEDSGDLTLSSEIKAINDHAPEFDEVTVKRFLARLTLPPRTAVKNARHVIPGRIYKYSVNSGRLRWVYFHTSELGQVRDLRGDDAKSAVGYELSKAVKRRLKADVDVGCYLSGGIDSALIAATAVEQGAKPKTFSVGFLQEDLDESKQAAAIAKYLGLEHHSVHLHGENFFEHLVQSICAFENPVANPHGAAKHVLSSLASKHVRVVLSGEGADEWFAGYPYHRIYKLREFERRHPVTAMDVVSKYLEGGEITSTAHLGGCNDQYDKIISRFFGERTPAIFGRLARPNILKHFLNEDESFIEESMFELGYYFLEDNQASTHRISEQMDIDLWVGQKTDLVHYILANLGDRQEMAHSIEGRTPFLDPNVTNVAARVDVRDLISGLNEKKVLRALAEDKLPSELVQPQKHAFFAPTKYLFRRASQQAIQDYIDIARGVTPWLNWTSIDHLLEKRHSAHKSRTLADMDMNIRLSLFSLGVLRAHLKEPILSHPRGYLSPICVEDIKPHRVTFFPEEELGRHGTYC